MLDFDDCLVAFGCSPDSLPWNLENGAKENPLGDCQGGFLTYQGIDYCSISELLICAESLRQQRRCIRVRVLGNDALGKV